jgi:putative FmdB family regulatory protein
MPIYEYECEGCKRTYEVLVRGASDEGVRCPACGGSKRKRLFSVFAAGVGHADASPCGECAGASACGHGHRGPCGGGCGGF